MELFTLRQVREQLWANGLPGEGGPSSYADATAQEIESWNLRLNRVIQTFFEMMVPARTYLRVDLPIYDSQFTLPRECRGALEVMALDNNGLPCSPLLVYSRFHQFAQWCPNACPCGPIQPISENAQTFRIPEAPFRLRVTSTEANGSYTFYGGKDENEDELFDSVQVAITNGSATSTREWSTLPRMAKPVTNVACEVYAVDASNVATLIAVHAPNEINPAYQRYSAPQWEDEPAVRVLTRLCYVKLTADSDVVIPSSWRALSRGLMALRYEDNGDDDRAETAFNKAVQLIDSDKQLLEGEAEVPFINAMPEYAASGTHPWMM